MDGEDESATYLKYFNDPTTTLLGNNVELGDTFPFAEIGTSDWQTETFPVLINADSDDIHLFKEEPTTDVSETVVVAQSEDGDVAASETLPNFLSMQDDVFTTAVNVHENSDKIQEANQQTDQANQKTYINYSPIVKENANGNKEIYLTEKDINNDASIIQLLNADGSVITIDKALLSSLNIPEQNGVVIQQEVINYEPYYSPVIAYKCKMCSELCESKPGIKNHLNQKHQELFPQNVHLADRISLLKSNNQISKKYKIYLCSICKTGFSEKDKLREHMIKNHKLDADKEQPQRQFNSNSNSRTLSSLMSLRTFLIKHQKKARKKVVCTIKGCNLRFSRDEIREQHEECHVDENHKQFKCPVCDEKFSIWRICSNHLWKYHQIDIGLLYCPMCNNFKTNVPAKLMEHLSVHDDEKPFLCKECGNSFKTQVQLRNHEIQHLKTEQAKNNIDPSKLPKKLPDWVTEKWCQICERYFANSKCLKMHIQSVHENFKPFVCNICGHKAARKAMLEVHIRQHTGVKPHKCSYCDYRTGDHNCLRKHVMKHKGLWSYKCPHCKYTSIQSISYKNHIKNRHPGKSGTYNCNFCSYTSINFTNYTVHIKRHENGLQDKEKSTDVQGNFSNAMDVEDEETQTLFNTGPAVEETIDTGGITIPADLEIPSEQ